MSRLFAVPALLIASVQLIPAQIRPKPLFSQAYVDATRNVLDIEPAEAAAIEARLRANPEDFAARARLLAYYHRADIADSAESAKRVFALSIWLVEHHPESELLASPFALSGLRVLPENYAGVARSWERAIGAHPNDARVFFNAATFYRGSNDVRYRACLRQAAALDPDNANYGVPLGILYVEAMLSRSDPIFAAKAREQLDTTKSAPVVEAATRDLQSRYNNTLIAGRPDTALRDLAAKYFHRAETLDPKLDREFVYPQIKPEMVGMLSRTHAAVPAAAAVPKPRYLRAVDFPELPGTVAAALNARGCRIPQPAATGKRNVIRGAFLGPGHANWAVLCASGGALRILVFRDDSGAPPHEIRAGLGDGSEQAIGPVGRDYIVRHYRAYGGPKPPPIDHEGLEYSFLEKGSTIYYWHAGQWMELAGAD